MVAGFNLFQGMRPVTRAGWARDALAGFQLAAMNIPQALGYTKIAGMPVVAGFYTLLLPLLAFAVFGSPRYLVVAADSATASILAGKLATMAPIASVRYVALASTVALLTGFLLLARILKLGFLADFLSQTVLTGFLTGVRFQVGIAVPSEMVGLEVHSNRAIGQLRDLFRSLPMIHWPTVAISVVVVTAVFTAAVVVLVGVEQGILIAMVLWLLRIVRHSYRPHTGVLVVNEGDIWHVVPAVPGAVTKPGLVIYRFGAALFYANASLFAEQIRGLVGPTLSPVRWLIVDTEAITNVDYTAARTVRHFTRNWSTAELCWYSLARLSL